MIEVRDKLEKCWRNWGKERESPKKFVWGNESNEFKNWISQLVSYKL